MMNDNYQAVYDAVRSRITGVNLSEAARSAMDFSFAQEQISSAAIAVSSELIRPSVMYHPKIFIDGNQWCALYGENLQDGVAGFGDSPDLAMRAFDNAWCEKLSSHEKGEAVEGVKEIDNESN